MRRSDFTFVIQRVDLDTRLARADGSVAAHFLQQNPNVNPRTLVLVMDYRATPKTITILSEEMFWETEYHWLAGDLEGDEIEDHFDEANEGLGYLVLWVAHGNAREWRDFHINYFADGSFRVVPQSSQILVCNLVVSQREAFQDKLGLARNTAPLGSKARETQEYDFLQIARD
ncbi:hypothetical protein C8J56DRAFT_898445 [Mycena floridula]|nr:hypothetical protein C8J56DRAFT_898445 [Mycena floridula]